MRREQPMRLGYSLCCSVAVHLVLVVLWFSNGETQANHGEMFGAFDSEVDAEQLTYVPLDMTPISIAAAEAVTQSDSPSGPTASDPSEALGLQARTFTGEFSLVIDLVSADYGALYRHEYRVVAELPEGSGYVLIGPDLSRGDKVLSLSRNTVRLRLSGTLRERAGIVARQVSGSNDFELWLLVPDRAFQTVLNTIASVRRADGAPRLCGATVALRPNVMKVSKAIDCVS